MTRHRGWLVLALLPLLVWLHPAEAQMADYSLAASRLADQLVQAFPKVRGLVVSVDANRKVILDLAAKDGVYPGLEMEIFREGEAFTHPVTGEVMGKMEKSVTFVKVTEVRDRYSVGELLDLETAVKQGDGVRVTGARILLGLAKVDAPGAGETAGRSLARELEVALQRSGRFEVFDDRLMRSTLVKAGLKEGIAFTDPDALQVLRRDLRLSVLALVKVSASTTGGSGADVTLVSARTGSPGRVASAEIPPAVAGAPPLVPAPSQPAPESPKQASRGPELRAGGPAWLGPPSPEGGRSPLNPHFTENPYFRGLSTASSNRTYFIQPMPPGIQSIAFGDVNGDGQDEMVGITENQVLVFTWSGSAFVLAKKVEGGRIDNYVSVDVADINGNGLAEIFVTNVDSRQSGSADWQVVLRSFVLEVRGEDLAPIWENVNLYFRVLKTPKYPEGVLLTQPLGRYTPYVDPLLRYRWNGKGYEPDRSLPFPTGLALYGMTLGDINGDDREDFVVMGPDGVLRVWAAEGKTGKKIAESKEAFGVFNHIRFRQVGREPTTEATMRNDPTMEDLASYRYIPRRLVLTNLGPEGRPGILVGANYLAPLSNLLRSIEITEASRVVHLVWDGAGLRTQWTTELSRNNYVADYGIAQVGGSQALAVLSLEKRFLRSTEGTLEIFRLIQPVDEQAARPAEVPR